MLECVKRQRQTKTEEQSDKRKKTICYCMTRQQQTETNKQGAKRKKTDHDYNTRKRQTETEEQAAKQKKLKRDCMRRKREEFRHQSQNDSRDCNGDNMTNVIDCDKTWEESAKCKKTMLECVKRQ